MLDNNFCELLENAIDNALANSVNEQVRHLWCDGVLLPTFDHEYSQKYVNDNRQISMIAFVGADGQERYELTLLFGLNSLSRYAKGLDISDCMHVESDTWFKIDITSKKIFIQLS